MKYFFTKLVLFTLLFLTSIKVSHAQTTPPIGIHNTFITTVSTNPNVRLDLRSNSINTPVWIEPAPGEFQQVMLNTAWTGFSDYTLQGNTLKIYDNYIGLDCSGVSDVRAIKNVAFSNADILNYFACSFNQIVSLNVNVVNNLKYFYCYSDGLTMLELEEFAHLKEIHAYDNKLTQLNIANQSCFNTHSLVLQKVINEMNRWHLLQAAALLC